MATELERSRDYFRAQADDELLPAEERNLWRHLAEEIDDYLNPYEQGTLV